MRVEQLHTLVNQAVTETLGTEDVVQEDLTNLVDVGREIIDTENVDNYVKKLVNKIGKTVFENKVYKGNAPSVLMDSWEYGSVLEKISTDLPTAQENDSWNLVDGKSYDDDIFYQPKVSAKFFNHKITFEIPMSFTEKQVKESFKSANELNAFISMLVTSVENAITIKLDSLVMATINNYTAEVLYNESTVTDDSGEPVTDYTSTSAQAVNLLTLYNEQYGTSVTKAQAVTDPDFIRYASYQMGVVAKRLSSMSTVFNQGGKERFTPKEDLHLVMISDFATASQIFLEADIINNELVALPKAETVPFWQGSGKGYDLEDTTKISIKTSEGNTVEIDGILGVMFDRQALGVANLDKRVTTNYNAKAEFYTNYYKVDSGYFNDFNENFVVFYIQ